LTHILLPLSIGLLWAVGFFAALTAYTLRDFSRSRLDEICRARGNDTRFGKILKSHEDVLLGVELVFTLVLLALLPLTLYWWGLQAGPGTGDAAGWTLFVAELSALAVALSLLLLVLPWTIARVGGEAFLYRAWPLLQGLLSLARPFVSLSRRIDQFAHRLADREQPAGGDAATLTDEIRTVVDEGQREGVLETEASTMIRRVMELQDEDAAAVMTPRTDMVCIQVDSTLEEARQKLLEAGHSRVPVIGASTDDIVGILYAKDLLKHADPTSNGHTPTLKEIAREPLYVPETTGIDKLLETMKREHVHIGIVVDEYGGVAGLVSLEDILEEIVGEIVDEYDSAQEDGIHQIQPGLTEVDARVHIDDLNERFKFNLPEDGDFDTVGGFVYTQLNRVPDAKDTFTWRQLRFTVLDADKRRIRKLRIEVDESLAASLAEES